MSTNVILYGIITFLYNEATSEALVLRQNDESLGVFNPSQGHETFEYTVKRDNENEEAAPPMRHRDDRVYFRLGRSQEDSGSSSYGQIRDREEIPVPTIRGKNTNPIRYGRSDPSKAPRILRKVFGRTIKSGRQNFIRFGRSPPSISAADARMAILCPNVSFDEDPRDNENLQLYLAKLVYFCTNNNNNNNNVNQKEESDENSRQDDVDFVGITGESAV